MRLADIRHWVFDMDGTLTRAVHDFPAIRRALDIPEQDDILLHLAALPEAEAAAKHAWLLEHERAWPRPRGRRRAHWNWCASCSGAACAWAS